MRTTRSIEDDVAHMLREEMSRSGSSLKGTINRFLRLGLTAPRNHARKRFEVTPIPMGLPSGMSYDNIGVLLEQLEARDHK